MKSPEIFSVNKIDIY